MHWVDRGTEPEGLKDIRAQFTPGWVNYYLNDAGPRPSDGRWRDFHDYVGHVFFGLCGYCEVGARGEVDHFRPKSIFPGLVYEWSNWVFACHDCNMMKTNNWPSRGYVDPCAKTRPARPENFFDFDTVSGEIIVKAGLSPIRRQKATNMIDDLSLNAHHHLRDRQVWVRAISESIPQANDPNPASEAFLAWAADRGRPFSSIARQFILERGYSIAD